MYAHRKQHPLAVTYAPELHALHCTDTSCRTSYTLCTKLHTLYTVHCPLRKSCFLVVRCSNAEFPPMGLQLKSNGLQIFNATGRQGYQKLLNFQNKVCFGTARLRQTTVLKNDQKRNCLELDLNVGLFGYPSSFGALFGYSPSFGYPFGNPSSFRTLKVWHTCKELLGHSTISTIFQHDGGSAQSSR